MWPGLLRHAARNKKKKKESHRSPRGTESLPLKTFFLEFTEFLSHETSPSLNVCLQIPGRVVASSHAAAQIPRNDFFLLEEVDGFLLQREAFWIRKVQNESPKGLNEGLTLYWLL